MSKYHVVKAILNMRSARQIERAVQNYVLICNLDVVAEFVMRCLSGTSVSYYQVMSCKVVSLLSYCHLFSLQPMHPFIPEAHVSELILIEVCKGIEAISVQNPFALRLFCHLVCSWMTNYGFVLWQSFGRDLSEAQDWCRKYQLSRNVKDLTQAWDLYYHVFRKITKQLPQVC